MTAHYTLKIDAQPGVCGWVEEPGAGTFVYPYGTRVYIQEGTATCCCGYPWTYDNDLEQWHGKWYVDMVRDYDISIIFAPFIIDILSCEVIDSDTVRLSWFLQCCTQYYDIRYSESPINMSNWGNATQCVGEPEEPLDPPYIENHFNVTGLDPGTTYYFAMKRSVYTWLPEESLEWYDWSGVSNQVNCTTVATPTPTVTPTATPTCLPCAMWIESGSGGSVTEPGEGFIPYCGWEVFDLVAVPVPGCSFGRWTGDTAGIDDVFAANTTLDVSMCSASDIIANFNCSAGVLTGSEWWLWQIYYNSTLGGSSAEENTVYHIANVRAVDATANVTYDAVGEDDTEEMTEATPPERGFTNYNAPGAAIIDWSVDQSGAEHEPTRGRVQLTGITCVFCPARERITLMDREIYAKGNDSTCWIDADSLPRRYGTTATFGDGELPTDALYSYQDDNKPANSSAPPGPHDGYPFSVGEDDWKQWEWVYFDGVHTEVGYDQQRERGYRWEVNRTIATYNVAAMCEAPAASGVFDVTEVLRKNTFFRVWDTSTGSTAHNNSGEPDYTRFYWNDSVKNYVRLLDLDTYEGREDWGIVDYETRDIGATIQTFSDSGSGFDIGVRITNTAGAAGNFSVLALIMDMDAVTDDSWSDGVAYINGETVYPNVSSWASISEAIQHTGTLQPGNSTVLTWSNVGSSGGTPEYKLWCMGATATLN